MKHCLILLLALPFLFAATMLMPRSVENCTDFFPDDCCVTVCCRQTSLLGQSIGCGNLVTCTKQELLQVLQGCSGVDGISFAFDGTQRDFEILQQNLRLKVLQSEKLEKLTIVCGISPVIRGRVLLNCGYVNVQLAFDGQTITFGSPLILDSY